METPRTTPAPTGLYLFNPVVDLIVIAGGLTFVLFPLGILASSRLSEVAFLVLLFFCNYPHYMATNYRIYRSRSQIQRYKVFSIHLTAVMVLAALIGHLMADVWIKVLYTVYFTWSPYHYTGQNYGITLMYLRRGGTQPSSGDRRLLYWTMISCFLMYVVFINMQAPPSPSNPFLSIGLAGDLARGLYVGLLAIALACGGAFLWRVGRRAAPRTMTPVLLLVGSQFAWFAFTTGVPLFTERLRLQWLSVAGLAATVAFLHCAQYLGVTAYYTKREEQAEHRSFSLLRYYALMVIGGCFLWVGSVRVLSDVFRVDYGLSFLIMLSLINIHHFVMDGAIWKLRDGPLARLLIGSPADAAAAAPAAPRRWTVPALVAGGVVAAVLGTTDVAYRLLIRRANAVSRTGRVDEAVGLYGRILAFNWRSAEALDGLAFWDLRRGDAETAAARWERSIRLNPTSAYAYIGLGETYLGMGRYAEAIGLLERAIALAPFEPSGYQLLARAYEVQGHPDKAAALRARADGAHPPVAAREPLYY